MKHIILQGNKVYFGEGLAGTQEQRFKEINEDTKMKYDGFIIYEIWPDFVEMNQIYVAIRNKRKGLATRLFKHLEKKAVSLGHDKIYIRVTFSVEDLEHPFYNLLVKLGYQKRILPVALPELGKEIWYKYL
jgi:hypothetical protein